jgi:predicted negative regulator of RcsB-dependent stress response
MLTMSEQKVSNERKRELQQMDPFQASLLKGMSFAKQYQKQLFIIAGVLGLVVVIFSSVMYSFQKSEHAAATLVSQAISRYNQINDPQKGYLEVKNDFQTIFTDFSNTAAGRQALVQFAKINYAALKFDESYKYYQEAFKELKNEALMKNFILSSMGHVCIARKEFDEAKKYFMQIKNGQSELLKDEASFTLAMLNEITNDITQSKKMYSQIVVDHANSIYAPIARSKIK